MAAPALFLTIARVLLISAGVGVEIFGAPPPFRNIIQLSALALILLLSFRDGAPRVDLPFPRKKYFSGLFVMAAAAACAFQTFTIPYLADDYATLARARQASTPLEWLTPGNPSAGHFLRPVGWWIWWFCDRCTPESALAARIVSIALFSINSLLVLLSLRKFGVRRGVATAAALIFALHPIGLNTVAWLSNFYSQGSLTLALAAILMIPPRGQLLLKTSLAGIVYFLALMSKEDVALFFILAGVAAAGGRLARWKRALAASTVFFVIFIITLGVKYWVLGSFGSYRSDADTIAPGGFLYNWAQLIATDFPGRYWLPLRESVLSAGERRPESIYAIPLIIWLAMGGLAPGARRAVALGFVILILAVVPVASLADLGPDLTNIRLLFFGSVGISLILAGAIAGLRRLAAVRWIFIMIGCGLAIWLGRRNLEAYQVAGRYHERAFADVSGFVKNLPPGSTIQIEGLNLQYRGVYAFNAALPWGFLLRCGRTDLDYSRGEPGRYDLCLEFDHKTEKITNPLDPLADPSRLLELKFGETLKLTFEEGSRGREATRIFGAAVARDPFVIKVRGTEEARAVRFPRLRVPAPCRIVVSVDGSFDAAARDATIPIGALYRRKNSIFRGQIAGGILDLPAEASILQLELTPSMRSTMTVRSISVRAEPL